MDLVHDYNCTCALGFSGRNCSTSKAVKKTKHYFTFFPESLDGNSVVLIYRFL